MLNEGECETLVSFRPLRVFGLCIDIGFLIMRFRAVEIEEDGVILSLV